MENDEMSHDEMSENVSGSGGLDWSMREKWDVFSLEMLDKVL